MTAALPSYTTSGDVTEDDDEYVLYTDCDVLFFRDPALSDIRPQILAAAPEYAQMTTAPVPYYKIFNSGVMLINVRAFRNVLPGLIEFSRSHDFYFHGDGGFYDQGALNKFFSGQWDPLDQSLNWRPFAGHREAPHILHFHGIKPYELAYILAGQLEKCRPIARQLFDLQPLAYLMACEAYLDHLPTDAEGLVTSVSPNTPGFVQIGRGGAADAIGIMRSEVARGSSASAVD